MESPDNFHALENGMLLDRSKVVCIQDDLAKLKDNLNKTDVIESFSQERMDTKWRFYKLTNLTVFAALFKDIPMGSKHTLLAFPLLENCTVNCFTVEEKTRLPNKDNRSFFGAPALQSHGK